MAHLDHNILHFVYKILKYNIIPHWYVGNNIIPHWYVGLYIATSSDYMYKIYFMCRMCTGGRLFVWPILRMSLLWLLGMTLLPMTCSNCNVSLQETCVRICTKQCSNNLITLHTHYSLLRKSLKFAYKALWFTGNIPSYQSLIQVPPWLL